MLIGTALVIISCSLTLDSGTLGIWENASSACVSVALLFSVLVIL
jgi:hypothetical protein